ncbi:polysaccharide pyruvyl transferase family protein [Chitinispirillales bacterium ANBcel5]|uniref:polysaccharide pyruvyl transferase family protein n=1 Tax=Cellulosispirillum alkaliphilum TaxID=3039283 RepID=UPI002A5400EB|nr:polysaccharide pyruvyl transferase family protein [Chitinispirillales bacterium ANBcel5]
MGTEEIIGLKQQITEKISSLINSDYIFLDLPYYTNIGDVLIWKGTEDMLKTLPYKCIYKSSIENYVKPQISSDVIILLQGGGNFGDIWRRHTKFSLKIIQDYPENRIIILPQTVYYKSSQTMHSDAHLMSMHKNLTLCARDTTTFKLLNRYFSKNHLVLMPDMAFCISRDFINKYKNAAHKESLFINRKDQEQLSPDQNNYTFDHNGVEEREWPSMEKPMFHTKMLFWCKKITSALTRRNVFPKTMNKLTDFYAQKIFMPKILKLGIQFISEYQYVYSTRLHGAILAVLLNKPVTFFDNSYGKNSTFYTTWLKNYKHIKFIKKDEMLLKGRKE